MEINIILSITKGLTKNGFCYLYVKIFVSDYILIL